MSSAADAGDETDPQRDRREVHLGVGAQQPFAGEGRDQPGPVRSEQPQGERRVDPVHQQLQ